MFLVHHGVKGQQWGVRNGPPYPIEDKVLTKGTRLNSISSKYVSPIAYKNSGKPMYTYNPNDSWDRMVYRGPFAAYLVRYRMAKFIADHAFETIKDLKMPTRKERIQEFKNIYNSKLKKKTIKELQSVQKILAQNDVGSTQEMKKRIKEVDLKNLKDNKDWETAYEIFNHAMEASWRFKSTSEYVKNMAEKYDAMVDDNNQGIYNDAHDPIIIFKAQEALQEIGSRAVWGDEINDYLDTVRDEMTKKGGHVKL